jgi:hypothetical protein
MDERDTLGNITPQPNVNEIEALDITTGNQMGERSHVNNDTGNRRRAQKQHLRNLYRK